MKVIVCGGRDYYNHPKIAETLNMLHDQHGFTLLIEGGARGADTCAGNWAELKKIPHICVKADWQGMGKVAGRVRNEQMLEYGPDLVIAFPGGKGTAHMVEIAQKSNVSVYSVIE